MNAHRFQIMTAEGELIDYRYSLHDAIERAHELKQYAAWYGTSAVYVVDSTGLLQPINIP